MSSVSRVEGASSLATLAYITATSVRDERIGRTFAYGRGERVEHVGTLLPDSAPIEFADPEVMFNSLEMYEKSSASAVAKKMIIALPREWNLDQSIAHIEEYISENLISRGYGATYAIHNDADGNNPHVHILIPNRQIDSSSGEWMKIKSRKVYAIDDDGKRIPVIDPSTGQQKLGKRNEKLWKRITVQTNPLTEKATLLELRAAWSELANRYLAPNQHIDHRSLKAQGIEREPTIHEGYAARAVEARGGVSERCELNRQIHSQNALIARLSEKLAQVTAHIHQVKESIDHEIRRLLSSFGAQAYVRAAKRGSEPGDSGESPAQSTIERAGEHAQPAGYDLASVAREARAAARGRKPDQQPDHRRQRRGRGR